ncbi:GSCOCG00011168001-RA-CDS [Cotesia congregata]|nr:GSCOCG00011168001-RA-CDS [Cotesia congregata]
MDKKTTLAYVAVLEHFKSTLAQHLQPKKFTVDYESGLASAVSLVYPDALICRCYFHYLQALVRRLKSYGKNFMTQLENWEEAQIFVRKIASLPFLPAHCISEAFEWLINNTTNDLKIFFDPFIEYVLGYWLRTVGPTKISVFKLKIRTNNAIESYHKNLHKLMGVHPSIWQFTVELVKLQNVNKCEVASLLMGKSIRRPTQNFLIERSNIIVEAMHLHEKGDLDIPRFLACANHFLRVLKNKNLLQSTSDLNCFMNAPNLNRVFHPIQPANIFAYVENNSEMPILRQSFRSQDVINIYIYNNIQTSVCVACSVRSINKLRMLAMFSLDCMCSMR